MLCAMRRPAAIGFVLGLLALAVLLTRAPREPVEAAPSGSFAARTGASTPAVAAAPPAAPEVPPSEAATGTALSPVAEPDAARFADAEGDPTPAFVRGMLDDAIAEHLPSYKLSPDDLDRLTSAVVELRSAQEELRALPWEPEHAERRKLLLARVARASETFEHVLDMDLGEFSEAVQPGVGIDRDDGPPGTGIDRDEPGSPPDLLAPTDEPEFLEPR